MIASILITNYNKEAFLEEAISSCLNQDFNDFEIVLIDDGSTDNSKEIIESFKALKNFRYILNSNQGIVNSRNEGIRACKGEFILQLDGDDKIGKNFLKLTVPVLQKDNNVGIVYCKTSFFGGKKGEWNLGDFSIEKQLVTNQIVITALFRKDDFLKTNGYSHYFDDGYEDWDFWMSILELGRSVVQLDSIQFYYRILANSRNIGISQDTETKLKYNIWKNHQSLYDPLTYNPVNLLWQLEKLKSDNKDLLVPLNSFDYKLGKALLFIPRLFKKMIKNR